MFWLKLKAGALQLTLFIAIIIALILTGFILLVHTHNQFNIQTDFIIDNSQNTNKGINAALISNPTLNDTTNINLEDEDYKTLKVHREFWGVFEKITSVATIKKNTLKRVALVGGIQTKKNRTALYVQDNNKPLVLVGNTKIEGVAYISESGVRPGTISGQSYYGSQLIYGTIRRASILPKLYSEMRSHLKTTDSQIAKSSINDFITLENGKTYSNSFLNSKQVVFSNLEIQLSNVSLIGNIIVQSKTKITVDASAKLKDVVLIAPKIEIKDNTKGNFQAIASKEISVGKAVTLEYPSALVLSEKDIQESSNTPENGSQNRILIDDNAIVKGIVMYVSKTKTNNYNAQIEIKEKATILGEVYCSENVELKGTVYGSVFTNNFIAKQFGSVYQNHIYNGTVNVNVLQEEYIGLSFKDSKKGVIKWLY